MLTLLFAFLAFSEVIDLAQRLVQAGERSGAAAQYLFALLLLALLAGSLAYLIARGDALPRLFGRGEVPSPDSSGTLSGADRKAALPSLVVLVPSYMEEPVVVRRTLLSAALQQYPGLRVVLLIDDPPSLQDPADQRRLEDMREMTGALQLSLAPMATRIATAAARFDADRRAGSPDMDMHCGLLAECLDAACRWVYVELSQVDTNDHADRLLRSAVLDPLYDQLAASFDRFARGCGPGSTVSADELAQAYRGLGQTFQVSFSVFERKRYSNLSHEPNKAMNLNSYLALMGNRYRRVEGPRGEMIVPCGTEAGGFDFEIPDADLVLTLDADSVLVPDYASKLTQIMLAPGNERIAVAQTPYSAFPGAPGLVERIAGAQTDIQYLMHQGFHACNGAFWVGANALLRKSALADIATESVESGMVVKKFIQDRTVIEDTESSIDLVSRGWRLHNHPERLAYSATPPDFGSLLIQRRRWANGGLIILPKAVRYFVSKTRSLRGLKEAFLRTHYLSSVAAVNIAFLLILFGPFQRNLSNAWIPAFMAPFMFAYAADLVRIGYRLSDFPRVYALNLVLLPVNLGGTFKSIGQIVSGRRTPFGRTPKVAGRTAAPGSYVLLEYVLLMLSALFAAFSALQGHFLAAACSAGYSLLLGYGIVRFIGLRASAEDLALWLQSWSARLFVAVSGAASRDDGVNGAARVPPGSGLLLSIRRRALGLSAALTGSVLLGIPSGAAVTETADSRALPIIVYHQIRLDAGGPPDSLEAISLEKFEAQMRWLHERGYRTLSADDAYRHAKGDLGATGRMVAVHFDDGWKSARAAIPILERYNIKATFWIIAGTGIGWPHMDWDEVEAIARHPLFDVESHSMTHPWKNGDTLPDWISGRAAGRGVTDVQYELEVSRRILSERLSRPVQHFAWPRGAYNERLIELALAAGYSGLFTVDEGVNRPGTDTKRIRRTMIHGGCGMKEFEQTLKDGIYRACESM